MPPWQTTCADSVRTQSHRFDSKPNSSIATDKAMTQSNHRNDEPVHTIRSFNNASNRSTAKGIKQHSIIDTNPNLIDALNGFEIDDHLPNQAFQWRGPNISLCANVKYRKSQIGSHIDPSSCLAMRSTSTISPSNHHNYLSRPNTQVTLHADLARPSRSA